MTSEKVIEVVSGYIKFLRENYDTVPVREPDSSELRKRLNHLDWMCNQIAGFCVFDRLDKAYRWLGFLQGAFWSMGIQTVEQSKRDNMSEGTTFDKNRV